MGAEASPAWFEAAFAELYPLLYAHRDDATAAREIGHLLRVIGAPGRGVRALDLACGNGRHAMALAGRGLQLYGLDLSPELLRLAGARDVLRGRLVRGDMRRLPFTSRFDLVLNLFTSFGYFPSDEENQQALREMARVLRPRGQLVMDHINRQQLEATLVPEDSRHQGAYHIRQRRWIDGQRIKKEIRLERKGARPQRVVEDVRLFAPDELAAWVVASGFDPPRFYGSFSGAPFDAAAPRMILVARRSAAGKS